MPILILEIDDIKYEVECKEGEEKLLRESEQLLNNKFEQNKQIKNYAPKCISAISLSKHPTYCSSGT